jgi:hypothetical protein
VCVCVCVSVYTYIHIYVCIYIRILYHKNYFKKTVFITGVEKDFFYEKLYIFLCFFGVNLGKFCRFFHELKFKKLQGGGIGARSGTKSFFETVYFYAVFTAQGRVRTNQD